MSFTEFYLRESLIYLMMLLSERKVELVVDFEKVEKVEIFCLSGKLNSEALNHLAAQLSTTFYFYHDWHIDKLTNWQIIFPLPLPPDSILKFAL